jgi:hypothetical protein
MAHARTRLFNYPAAFMPKQMWQVRGVAFLSGYLLELRTANAGAGNPDKDLAKGELGKSGVDHL